jgi:hypothetical protein
MKTVELSQAVSKLLVCVDGLHESICMFSPVTDIEGYAQDYNDHRSSVPEVAPTCAFDWSPLERLSKSLT